MNDDDRGPGYDVELREPGSAPLRPRGGVAKRERSTFERTASRWHAHGKVVPITGTRRGPESGTVPLGQRGAPTRDATFEAVVEWLGPPLPEFGRQPGRRPVDAQTGTIVDDQELARAIVIAALELIDRGEVPFMDSIRDAMRARGLRREGWLDRYRELVGDEGHAAAEGYV